MVCCGAGIAALQEKSLPLVTVLLVSHLQLFNIRRCPVRLTASQTVLSDNLTRSPLSSVGI
jgi:hypothetical protein